MTAERVHINMGHLVELYEAGHSVKALAEFFSTSRRTVTARLDIAGVVRRSASDQQLIRQAAMTPGERMAQVEAAHAAKRGRPNSLESRCAGALTRQRLGRQTAGEVMFNDWLRQRGLVTIPQQAIGPYNCDLGADPVAVEVFGGNWHATGAHARSFPDRANYLLDRGWSLLIVWNQSRDPISPSAADYTVSWVEEIRRNPPAVSQYRVIRGCGKDLARGEGQFDHLALIPSQRRSDR